MRASCKCSVGPGVSHVAMSSPHEQVVIGNRAWMRINGLRVTRKMENEIQSSEEQGQTVILIAIDRKIVSLYVAMTFDAL